MGVALASPNSEGPASRDAGRCSGDCFRRDSNLFRRITLFYLADGPGLDERFTEAALGAFAKDKAVCLDLVSLLGTPK
jgi:hypothetical protein